MQIRPKYQNVAIVGITRETTSVLSLLQGVEGVRVVRVINPDYEDVRDLERYQFLDIIINATDDHGILQQLKSIRLGNVDVISGLSARILFLSGRKGAGPEKNWGEERARILKSLHEIKQAVLLSKNKEELLKLFLEVAIGSCNADSGSIMLLEPNRRFLNIEMADGLNVDIVRSTAQRFGKGIAGKVARTGKPVLLTGPIDSEDGPEGRSDIISAMSCPLLIGQEVVGVININSKNKYRVFAQGDLRYLEELSGFIGEVVKASKDFELTSSSAFSLSMVGSAQEIMDMDFPFEERLNLLLMKIVNTSGGIICNYYDYDEVRRCFFVKASSSFNRNLLRGKRIRLNDQIADEVLKNQKTTCLQVPNQLTNNKKWFVAQPVKVRKRMVGLLFLHLVSPKDDIQEEKEVIARISTVLVHEFNKSQEMQNLKIQSTKLSAVSEASFHIANAKDIRELVNFAVPYACLVMEAEAGVFWLLNPVSDRLEMYKSFAIQDNVERLKKIIALDAQIFDRTVPGDDVLLVEDLQQEGFTSSDEYPRSLLSKTFGRNGQIAGVLSLYGKKSLDLYGTDSFSKNDKEVFMKFALQLSKGLAKLMPYFDEKR